jgi:hypothetical protein
MQATLRNMLPRQMNGGSEASQIHRKVAINRLAHIDLLGLV